MKTDLHKSKGKKINHERQKGGKHAKDTKLAKAIGQRKTITNIF